MSLQEERPELSLHKYITWRRTIKKNWPFISQFKRKSTLTWLSTCNKDVTFAMCELCGQLSVSLTIIVYIQFLGSRLTWCNQGPLPVMSPLHKPGPSALMLTHFCTHRPCTFWGSPNSTAMTKDRVWNPTAPITFQPLLTPSTTLQLKICYIDSVVSPNKVAMYKRGEASGFIELRPRQ